jgi:hypothetical protein
MAIRTQQREMIIAAVAAALLVLASANTAMQDQPTPVPQIDTLRG